MFFFKWRPRSSLPDVVLPLTAEGSSRTRRNPPPTPLNALGSCRRHWKPWAPPENCKMLPNRVPLLSNFPAIPAWPTRRRSHQNVLPELRRSWHEPLPAWSRGVRWLCTRSQITGPLHEGRGVRVGSQGLQAGVTKAEERGGKEKRQSRGRKKKTVHQEEIKT